MHCVTDRNHGMEKYMFGVRCLDTLFMESVSVPSEQEK
jgi:hypothetical protein